MRSEVSEYRGDVGNEDFRGGVTYSQSAIFWAQKRFVMDVSVETLDVCDVVRGVLKQKVEGLDGRGLDGSAL